MKNIFLKGTMVLLALFVLFTFTGCPDPVSDLPIVDPGGDNTGDTGGDNTGDGGDENNGSGDTGNETTYSVAEIKIVDKDGNSPSDTSDPSWTTIFANTSHSIVSVLNTAFPNYSLTESSYVSTYGTIAIDESNQVVTEEVYNTLISSLNSNLDFTYLNDIYDFTVFYDSATKIINVTYIKNPDTGENTNGILQAGKYQDGVYDYFILDSSGSFSYYDINGNLEGSGTWIEENNNLVLNWSDGTSDTATIENTTSFIWSTFTYTYTTGDSGNQGDGGNTETPSAPSAPTNITATALSETEVRVTWNSVSDATKYEVFYGTSFLQDLSASLGTTTNTYATITGLNSGTSYYFWVSAINTNGTSDFDEPGFVKTKSPDPYFFFTVTPSIMTDGNGFTFEITDHDARTESYNIYRSYSQYGTQTLIGSKNLYSTSTTIGIEDVSIDFTKSEAYYFIRSVIDGEEIMDNEEKLKAILKKPSLKTLYCRSTIRLSSGRAYNTRFKIDGPEILSWDLRYVDSDTRSVNGYYNYDYITHNKSVDKGAYSITFGTSTKSITLLPMTTYTFSLTRGTSSSSFTYTETPDPSCWSDF